MDASFVISRATPLHSFMDYVKGGCQISLMMAIDFTVSGLFSCHTGTPKLMYFVVDALMIFTNDYC